VDDLKAPDEALKVRACEHENCYPDMPDMLDCSWKTRAQVLVVGQILN
jgi:hypothetical protein